MLLTGPFGGLTDDVREFLRCLADEGLPLTGWGDLDPAGLRTVRERLPGGGAGGDGPDGLALARRRTTLLRSLCDWALQPELGCLLWHERDSLLQELAGLPPGQVDLGDFARRFRALVGHHWPSMVAVTDPADWRQALWATALAPLAMLGAIDVPARMSPSPAWFASPAPPRPWSRPPRPCPGRSRRPHWPRQPRTEGPAGSSCRTPLVASRPTRTSSWGLAAVGWEAVVIGLLAGAVAGLLFGRFGRGGDGGGIGGRELDRRLAGISDSLDRRLVDLDRRLYLGLDSVQDAQARAADTAAQVRERVAVVAGVAEQVLEQARGLSRLEDLLRPPQARGALGELLLEQLLAQGLPGNAYRTQHLFRSGARVDAVLLLGEAMVAVDSKFPLEAFARMSTTPDGDAARALHRRAFVRDARRHVDAIADKYICPDEGTYDFALCYLPSEAVFYEFLREDPPGDSCWRYAVERRVFPTSPTTLYAYLVSIGVGLKGLRVEENARRVLDALAALRGDLDGFRTHFELVGRHLGRARDRWQDAAHRLDRFDGRLAEAAGRATDLDRGAVDREVEGEPSITPALADPDAGLTGTG